MADYSKMKPEEVRELIRKGEITIPTAGMCGGYAQANLVILPKTYADDFREFARKNPKPCPILEVLRFTIWERGQTWSQIFPNISFIRMV